MRDLRWGAAVSLSLLWLIAIAPRVHAETPPGLESAPPESSDTVSARFTILELQKLQSQNEALLRAIERVRHDTDEDLGLYAEAMAARIAALEQSLARQGAKEYETLRAGGHRTFYLALGVAALLALCLVLFAILPMRMAERAATKAMELVWTGDATAWVQPGSVRLHAIIHRLERQIVQRELQAMPRQVAAAPLTGQAIADDASAELPMSPDTPVRPPRACSEAPQFAMALGEGESIVFVPQDRLTAHKSGLWWNLRERWRRMLRWVQTGKAA